MTPMRVALFTNQFPGRINTFFARDVRGLLDAGVEVEVFAIHPLSAELWPYVPEVLSPTVFPRTHVHHLGMMDSLRAVTSGVAARTAGDCLAIGASALRFGPTAFAKSAYVMPKALAWARQHGQRFDHIVAYWGNYAATCAYLFHRAAGRSIPFSMFLHAGTDLYRGRVFLEQKLLYADNIFVVCDFNRRFLQQTYPAIFPRLAPKIHLHHLGLDLDELPFSTSPRVANRVIAVGGLHRSKGFDDLLGAAALAVAHGHALDLRIVGDGPEGPNLRRLASRLGLSVEFLGWRRFDEVRTEIRDAALLVHPSPGLGDAVPTVIKEAMALGTPVIASAVAGIPELLDDGGCGVLVPPRDQPALASAIERLIGDDAARARLAQLARRRAEAMFDQSRNGRGLAARLRETTAARAADRPLAMPALTGSSCD